MFYILTNTMEQSFPSYSATQEIPSILRNQKIHYCGHVNPPLVPILWQMNLLHTTPPPPF
jgi:hypothetical protein